MTDMNSLEIADTVRWLERAVIGLNLCPFAKAPHVKGQIHYVVSQAKGLEGLRDELIEQLLRLVTSEHPGCHRCVVGVTVIACAVGIEVDIRVRGVHHASHASA